MEKLRKLFMRFATGRTNSKYYYSTLLGRRQWGDFIKESGLQQTLAHVEGDSWSDRLSRCCFAQSKMFVIDCTECERCAPAPPQCSAPLPPT